MSRILISHKYQSESFFKVYFSILLIYITASQLYFMKRNLAIEQYAYLIWAQTCSVTERGFARTGQIKRHKICLMSFIPRMGGDFIFVNQCRLDLKPPPVYKANFVYAKSFPLRLKHDLKLYQVIFTATRTSRRKIHLLAVQIHDHAEYRAKTYCLRLQFIIMTAYTVGIAGMIFHHMFYICNTHFVQQMLYHGSHASQAQNTVRKRYSCRILYIVHARMIKMIGMYPSVA